MDYATLKTQFLALLNNDECTPELADSFIQQGIRRIERIARLPFMERTRTFTVDPAVNLGEIAIPKDYLELINLYWNDVKLRRVSDSQGELYRQVVSTPNFYWREGTHYKFSPLPGEAGVIKIRYYGEMIDWTTDATIVASTLIVPDLVLYSALIYAADYFVDVRKQTYLDNFNGLLAEVQEQADRDELSGSGLAIRSPYEGSY